MRITKTVNLKKYENRKLYSPKGELTDKGAYITLLDLTATIKEGNNVNVTDKHGKDVTNSVLKEAVKVLEKSNSELVAIIRG